MAERQGIYISQLPESASLTDNMLFATDNGADNNSVSAANLAEYVNKKIDVPSQVNNGVSKAVNESKKWTVENFSRQNLLDNWYFADPVNQRGETTIQSTGSYKYFIDRWKTYANTAANKFELTSDGICLTEGAVTSCRLKQTLETWIVRELAGKTVTFSIFVAEITGSLNMYVGTNEMSWIWLKTINTAGVHSADFTVPDTYTGMDIMLQTSASGTDVCTIYAAKLEIGAQQTLAHQENGVWVLNDPPPNKQQELAKCQRYYWRSWSGERNTGNSIFGQVFANNKGRVTGFQFPVAMRAEPTITVYGRNGVGKITEWNNDEDYGDVWPVYWDERRCVALAYSGGQLDMGAYVYYFVEVNAEL